ncbi:MAG: hypothetical protein EXR70_13400 [Deltaproteobacteria bacterium]|nr:hypothetical protein [Deltaproteobacteria bacterium]
MKTNPTLLTIRFIVLIGMTALVLTRSNALAQSPNLSGQWTSEYRCPSGDTYSLTVQINHRGQQISAVKNSEDPCFGAGQTAFSGNVAGNSGQLTCTYAYDPGPTTSNNSNNVWLGILQTLADSLTPRTYAIGTTPGSLSVIDANNIVACTLPFVRDGLPPPAYGNSTPAQSTVAAQSSAGRVTLQQPTLTYDDANQKYTLRVNGQLRGARGSEAVLGYFFQYENNQTWTTLRAKKGSEYNSVDGDLASYNYFTANFDPYELGVLTVELPYAEINLRSGRTYKLRGWAEVFINNKSLESSTPVEFNFAPG